MVHPSSGSSSRPSTSSHSGRANTNDTSPLQPYLSLSSIQRKLPGEITRAFSGFPDADASPPEVRRKAIGQLLDDLDPENDGAAWHSWRASSETLALVCKMLKVLGRPTVGSEQLARERALRILSMHAFILPMPTSPSSGSRFSTSVARDSSPLAQISHPTPYPEYAKDAFRTLCNSLLQHSTARQAMCHMPRAVSGLVGFLKKNHQDEYTDLDVQFVAARALFLVTIERGSATGRLIEHEGLIDVISDYLEAYLQAMRVSRRASGRLTLPPQMDQLLSEHLKLIFNATLYYTKPLPASPTNSPPMSDDGHPPNPPNTMPMLGSTTSNTSTSTRSSSPLFGGAASGVKKFWKNRTGKEKDKSGSHSTSKSNSKDGDDQSSQADMSDEAAAYFDRAIPALLALAINLPTPPPGQNPFAPPLKHVIDALIHFPVSSFPPDWVVPSISSVTTSSTSLLPPVAEKILAILSAGTAFLVKGDDGLSSSDGALADESLSASLFLLRKMAADNVEVKDALRAETLPIDVDRSQPLDRRNDLLVGRLLILSKSATCPTCSLGASELLFTLCDRKPYLFSEQIGYGNATGFLTNIGANIPPPANWTTEDHRLVNSITGAYEDSTAVQTNGNSSSGSNHHPSDMTDEEKEAELDKLMFSLDRLNRTGVMKAEMPSMGREQASRFEEIEEQEEQTRREQEDRDVEEGEEEMRRYKARTRNFRP